MPYPIAPRQSLGQNFLQDPNTANKIVASLRASSEDHVVEVGPGLGALTERLRQRYPVFTALEIDERAIGYLHDADPGLDVRHVDALAADWAALAAEKGDPISVISNLPYNITSPMLFALLGARRHLREAVLMMQKEVAERLVAEPRTKAYGILSVILQSYAAPDLLFTVSRNVFYPKPDVTSAVVRLTFGGEEPAIDFEALRKVVRAAFNQRRKTLRNSLHAWTRERGFDLPDGWERRRAEELTPADFVDLTHYLSSQS